MNQVSPKQLAGSPAPVIVGPPGVWPAQKMSIFAFWTRLKPFTVTKTIHCQNPDET